jgi:hypothetical protein
MTVLQAPVVDGGLTARRPVRLDSIARATADIRDGRPCDQRRASGRRRVDPESTAGRAVPA